MTLLAKTLTNTNSWAKAGPMIRASPDSPSANGMITLTGAGRFESQRELLNSLSLHFPIFQVAAPSSGVRRAAAGLQATITGTAMDTTTMRATHGKKILNTSGSASSRRARVSLPTSRTLASMASDSLGRVRTSRSRATSSTLVWPSRLTIASSSQSLIQRA